MGYSAATVKYHELSKTVSKRSTSVQQQIIYKTFSNSRFLESACTILIVIDVWH